MKRYLLKMLLFLVSATSFSQEIIDTAAVKKSKLNRWSVDLAFGSSRGISPYNDGYFSTENDQFLGEVNLNSINLGARYYVNKYVTFKSDIAFDRFTPNNKKSLDFDVAQFRLSIQTMFNINVLFGLKESSRLKLLPHIGINIASLKTIKSSQNQVIGSPDNILGVIYGFSPMYTITKKTSLFIDLSLINNFRQHHTWDGNVSDEKNNLTGQMSAITLGISYKLGKPINNDTDNENKKNDETSDNELEKRVTAVEGKLSDLDKDGVPDYIDQENNSIEGAVVDSKGVMVDKNSNNIPDEIEKYLDKNNTISSTNIANDQLSKEGKKLLVDNKQPIGGIAKLSNDDIFKRAINEGFICVFFDTGKSAFKDSSIDSINYILTYLNANPNIVIDLIGYTDEIGNNEYNQQLGIQRANSVKSALVNLGIDPSRVHPFSGGEDHSYNPSNQETRSLVRKVIFRIK